MFHSPETVKKMDKMLHTAADKHAHRTTAHKGGRSSSSPKVVQAEVEPSVAETPETPQSNGEDPEPETPMMTPAASFSEPCPLPQLHKSQDTSTAAQLPPAPPPSPGSR